MPLRVYNTLSSKEPFNTVAAGKVGMYVCGPTVYKPSHIGHMVGPVIFDTVKRYLTYLGYEVTWVVNITDVDDKLIVQAEARDDGQGAGRADDRRLPRLPRGAGRRPGIDHMPRATEHIAEIIEITRGLIDKGFAYPSGGDVYFDVTKDADYGKLCNRDPEAARGRRPSRGQRPRSAIPAISPSGRAPSRASRRGRARGDQAGPAGTSNARP